MLAPVASETRSQLSASSAISACSAGEPSPAAAASAGWASLARLAMEDEAEAYLDAVRVDLVGWQAVEGADR